MMAQRASKTELDPNNVQRTLLVKSCGAARWTYNWGLQRKNEVLGELMEEHVQLKKAIGEP